MSAATATVEACRLYITALERVRRAEEAEGRTFAAWFRDRTPSKAGTARKAKSRVNALDMERIQAEDAIWTAIDAHPWDDTPAGQAARQADPERFAWAIINREETT